MMTISDQINAVLAVLALAGVAVAIWAVLLSERGTRFAYDITRFDVVAECANDITVTASKIDATIMPMWNMPDRLFADVAIYDEADADDPIKVSAKIAAASVTLRSTELALHDIINSLDALSYRTGAVLVTLPKTAQSLFVDRINNEINWVRACAMVAYLSVIDDNCRIAWAAPNAARALVGSMSAYYTSSDGSSAAPFIDRATKSLSGMSESKSGVAMAVALVNRSTVTLMETIVELGESFEAKRSRGTRI